MAKKDEEKLSETPRDPFTGFREEMNRLVDTFFGDRDWSLPSVFGGRPDGTVAVSIDVKESDKAITLTAELPGMTDKDIDLTLRNGRLTLKGEKKVEKTEDKDDVHLTERRFGSFQRTFRIPDTVDEEAVSASFDKGVLKVHWRASLGWALFTALIGFAALLHLSRVSPFLYFQF